MACAICQTRRPRRYCPGVRGDICSICCGTERENSVNCPLNCVYLKEAHDHERTPEFDPKTFPNLDIQVNDEFVATRRQLTLLAGAALSLSAFENDEAIDLDLREALEALIKTYKTRQTGLIYETRPANPVAARIQQRFEELVEEAREHIRRQTIEEPIRDSDLLRILVFLQRLEFVQNNGRPKSKAFLDHLSRFFAPPQARPNNEPVLIS